MTSSSTTLDSAPILVPDAQAMLEPDAPQNGYLTGGGLVTSFTNFGPSLVLNTVMPLWGLYPSRGDASENLFELPLGAVRVTAGSFSFAEAYATGSTLAIREYSYIFSVLGVQFGGNGATNFMLPNLTGRIASGAEGLHVVGLSEGLGTQSLSLNQMPGGGVPVGNTQPTLNMQWLIDVTGDLPLAGSGSTTTDLVGTLVQYAGFGVPNGYMVADGAELQISQWPTLFATIGTTYGGDGQTTFRLPDLRGRTPIGADTDTPVGTVVGQASTVLTMSNIPVSAGGGGVAITNTQPSLAVTYLIAMTGDYPVPGSSAYGGSFYVGEIVAFAGNYVPNGFMQASGQMLPIAGNELLFSVIGTTYGGDGERTFALPNLNDRAVMGAGVGYDLGQTVGVSDYYLTASDIYNIAPNIVGVDAAVSSTEQVFAVLDASVNLSDANLDGLNNYAGANLQVFRQGGANAEDAFRIDATGASFTVVGDDVSGVLQSGGLTFATYALSGGTLTITFTSSGTAATSALADEVASRIAYANQSDTPPAQVNVAYVFNDGNTGSQGIRGQGFDVGAITVNITDTAEPAPRDDALSGGEGDVLTGSVFADNGSGVDVDSVALEVVAVNDEAADVGVQITLTSGALLTLNADGTYSYDPNGAFDHLTEAPYGSNTSATDSFTYTLAGGGVATVTVTIAGSYQPGDALTGAAGNDLLGRNPDGTGGTGANVMTGGAGNDWYFVDDSGDTVVDGSGGGTIDRVFVRISNYTLTAGAEIEILSTNDHLGTTGVTLIGNDYGQRIQGNEGDDILDGRGGDDTLVGSGGSDDLSGGDGADYLNGGIGDDLLDGGSGDDQMFGGQGNDTYYVDSQNDRIVELDAQGYDTLVTSVSYVLANGVSIEEVRTSNSSGTQAINLTGNNLGNTLYGNAGNNILNGGGGADAMFGAEGDDWYYVDNESDAVHESAGFGQDRVFASTSWTLTAGSHVEIVSTTNNAGTQAINLTGNELNNSVYGNEGENTLSGGAGDDLLAGAGGADYLIGGAGRDMLNGGAGDDMLLGGEGDDQFQGGAGYDIARFSGTSSEYVIRSVGVNQWVVTDLVAGRDGQDYMINVERLWFIDTLVDLVAPSAPEPSAKEQGPQVLPGGEVAFVSHTPGFDGAHLALVDAWNDWAY